LTSAKKTTDEYAADIYAESGDNLNRLKKIIDSGALKPEMIAALERALPDPKVSTPAIERALEKWRFEDGKDKPRWSQKLGDTSIRNYRKTEYGIQ